MQHIIAKEFVALLVLLASTVPGWMRPIARKPHAFLQQYFDFSNEDLAAIELGKIVTKLPKTSDKREVAVLGVVRLKISKEFFLESFLDIESFKKSEAVLKIRKFTSPPRLEDLRDLNLESEHVNALKKCRPGECGVKIPAELIERVRKEINWSAADYKDRTTALTRQFLLDYVRSYLKEGNTALVSYGDQQYPQRMADEVRSMLDQSPYLLASAPEFHKKLTAFPQSDLPGGEDFLYWSKERIAGLKPVLSLTHVVVYKQRNEGGSEILIASKQLYANHYFEGSLGLTWVINAEDGCYLVYFNRSRVDALRGGLAWLKLYLARGRIRDGMIKNIKLIKERLENQTNGT